MSQFQNVPFCLPPSAGRQTQILTRLRRVNPRNTQCIPMVKIFVFLDLEQNCLFLDRHQLKQSYNLQQETYIPRFLCENIGFEVHFKSVKH